MAVTDAENYVPAQFVPEVSEVSPKISNWLRTTRAQNNLHINTNRMKETVCPTMASPHASAICVRCHVYEVSLDALPSPGFVPSWNLGDRGND